LGGEGKGGKKTRTNGARGIHRRVRVAREKKKDRGAIQADRVCGFTEPGLVGEWRRIKKKR